MVGRVALLIDGDNVSSFHADRLLHCAKGLGRLDVARVYAAANRPSDWLATPGLRLIHAGSGKNAADVLLCIDAMELALGAGPDCFVIASSDGDFTHLALRLRERGLAVHGMGAAHASQSFRAACSAFHQLSVTPGAVARVPQPPAVAVGLDHKIRSIVASHSKNGNGVKIAALGHLMQQHHQIGIDTLPERGWRGYLAKRPDLYALDQKGPDAMVRFRPAGFAQFG